jgi:Family of unknown function (DUF5906)
MPSHKAKRKRLRPLYWPFEAHHTIRSLTRRLFAGLIGRPFTRRKAHKPWPRPPAANRRKRLKTSWTQRAAISRAAALSAGQPSTHRKMNKAHQRTCSGNNKGCPARRHATRSATLRRAQQATKVQAKSCSVNKRWPAWSEPLDFETAPLDQAVARINAAGYFVIGNGDIYKTNPDGSVTAQGASGFNNFFASRCVIGEDGKLISAGAAWRRSQHRREYDRIGYWPDNHGRPAKSYNLWRGWGVEPKSGDCSIIHAHIRDVIADSDDAKANYILDWCAHMVQRPWEKPGVALVLKGRKGTGKSLLTEILTGLVGRRNAVITADGRGLFGKFNWHLADKVLIGAEEAFFARNRALNDKLKHLLTGTEIEVEQKFGHRTTMKSMHRMIITSNHADVVEISADERRFFVCDVSDQRRGDDNYFAPLWRVANGEDNTMLAAFMYELKTRDITNLRPWHSVRDAAALRAARQQIVSLLQHRASDVI